MAFADNNYQQNKVLYDTLAQVFDTYKYGVSSSGHSWNQPMEELRGVTMRLLGDSNVELTYHRYVVETVEGLERMRSQEDPGMKFLKSVVSELKKEFKNATGKALALKMSKEKPLHFEKVSRLTAESSWMLGSNRYGAGARPLGRYLVRTSCVYDLSSEL